MQINFNNVTKDYNLGKTKVNALRGVTLQINKGEFVCIAGPSGSGKTTLLNLIGFLDNISSGELFIDEININTLSESKKEKIRKDNIGYIFQSFNLIETLNVYENIEYPALGISYDKNKIKKRIESLLEEIEIADLIKRYPNELSGGQRQRVAIARAFINEPQIILADEPTANLDSETGKKIIDLMKKVNRENNTTLIFSTHDLDIINKAKRIIKIHDGKIEGETINA